MGDGHVDLLLGQAAVLHQPHVALLQIPGGLVELLVDFGVLVIHLTQQVHLLVQVLENKGTGMTTI